MFRHADVVVCVLYTSCGRSQCWSRMHEVTIRKRHTVCAVCEFLV